MIIRNFTTKTHIFIKKIQRKLQKIIMQKNIKQMFLFTTIIILLVGLTTINAAQTEFNQTNDESIESQEATDIQPAMRSEENRNTLQKNHNTRTKEADNQISTSLSLEFEVPEDDELSSENFLVTHKNEEYTINIHLSEEFNDKPAYGIVQLYLDEDSKPEIVNVDNTGYAKQTFTVKGFGEYVIYAIYQGNELYAQTTSDIIILSSERYDTTLTLNHIDNVCYNSSVTVEGLLQYDYDNVIKNAQLTVMIGDNPVKTIFTDDEGKFHEILDLKNIPIQDMLIIKVCYNSDREEFDDTSVQQKFSVEKIRNNIQIQQIQTPHLNENTEIKFTITDENNKTYTKKSESIITLYDVKNESHISIEADENGLYTLSFIPQKASTYNISIVTPEDEYYSESFKKIQLKVEKASLLLEIEETYESIVNENVSITGKVTDKNKNPLENIQVTVYTQTTELGTALTDSRGQFNFTHYIFERLNGEDEYFPVYVRTENPNYEDNIGEASYYLSHRNIIFTMQTSDKTKINQTLQVTGEVRDAYNQSIKPEGSVAIYINNRIVQKNIKVTDGIYTTGIVINDDYSGQSILEIEAYFIPEEDEVYYAENYQSKHVYLEILETNLTVHAEDTVVDGITSITITLQDENEQKLDKSVHITITDNTGEILQQQKVTLTGGSTTLTFTPQHEGIYHVIADYDGEENIYENSTQDSQITVRKITTNMTITTATNDYYVNDTITFKLKLKDSYDNSLENQNMELVINNKTVSITTDSKGEAIYEYTPLSTEKLDVTAIYEKTRKYDSFTSTITLTPKKQDVKIITQIEEKPKYDSEQTIKGHVISENTGNTANGTVTIKINDKTISTIPLVNGEYTTSYHVNQTGKSTITVIFNENEAFNTVQSTNNISITALETRITINPVTDTTINNTVRIIGSTIDENGNPVNEKIIVTLNEQTIKEVTPTEGEFAFDITSDYVGTNTITLRLDADNKRYSPTSLTETFTVTKSELKIENTEYIINNNKTVTVTGQLTDNDNISTEGIIVEIKVNNKTYYATAGNNGTFNITTEKLKVNNYTIEYKTNPTQYLEESAKKDTLSIEKDDVNIHTDTIDDVTFNQKLEVTGKLTDSGNNILKQQEVQIILDNIAYTTQTDSNGIFSISINSFQSGQNILTVHVPETDYTNTAQKNIIFIAKKDTPQITVQTVDTKAGEQLIIKGQLTGRNNKKITDKNVTIKINTKEYIVTTDSEGNFEQKLENILYGNYSVTVSFADKNYETATKTINITVTKQQVTLRVSDIIARIGENITFSATLTDEKDNQVSGGNIVFKLNGRTLRTDGRFDTNTTEVLKFNVENGVVKYTLSADLYLRHGKNISASYSGSYRYESTKSNTATASIGLRYSNINVTTDVSTVKHHENITFTAHISDVTPKLNTSYVNTGANVIFKINGVSIKDENNNVIRTEVVNNSATLKYNITPMAGIDSNHNIRNYTVTAVYDNPYYYPVNNKNTTLFSVERSQININIYEAKVSENKLSISATLTDYLDYLVVGTNKICVKINGITYKEDSVNKYFTINDGVMDIDDIDVTGRNVKTIEIVTGQRQAYYSARTVTDKIIKT